MASRSMLPCPRCRSHALEACEYGGYALDVCLHCHGLWCESHDWHAAELGARPGQPGQATASETLVGAEGALEFVAAQSGGPFRAAEWACPTCRVPLRLWSVRQVEGLLIDVCDGCGGVWFDHQEWQYLGAARDYQGQRGDIERPPTWGEWLFQLFLELPVEFNIKPRRLPWVTYALIAACCLLFLLLPQELVEQLALAADVGQTGKAYTFITYQFLHGDWLHLLGNMYLLYVLGDNVEDVLGRLGFLLVYLFCGVVGGLAYLMFTPPPVWPMIGASGAIAGIIAAYLVLFRRSRLTFMLIIKQFKPPAYVWIGAWLVIQIAAAFLDREGLWGVAWFAHLGGFAAGLLAILPLRKWLVSRYPLLYLLDSRRIHA